MGPKKIRLKKLWSDLTQIYSETLDLSFYKNYPVFLFVKLTGPNHSFEWLFVAGQKNLLSANRMFY